MIGLQEWRLPPDAVSKHSNRPEEWQALNSQGGKTKHGSSSTMNMEYSKCHTYESPTFVRASAAPLPPYLQDLCIRCVGVRDMWTLYVASFPLVAFAHVSVHKILQCNISLLRARRGRCKSGAAGNASGSSWAVVSSVRSYRRATNRSCCGCLRSAASLDDYRRTKEYFVTLLLE